MLLFITALSCSKTKYEQLERPYSRIERFTLGGYNALDSLDAVINDNEIMVYWSAEAELPKKIKPHIALSAGASISPASGEEVAFSESTTYTVTAEDGTETKYQLKPIINEAIPTLSGFEDLNSWSWGTRYQVKINGEYFLTSNNVADIRVHAQRLRDGFELDLEVDKEKTINTQLVVDLPKFTTEQDSGAHRVWVQVGEFPSNTMEIWINQPKLEYVTSSYSLKEMGKPIYIGDTLTFVVGLNPKIDASQFEKYITGDSYNFFTSGFRNLADEFDAPRINDTGNAKKNVPVVQGNEIKVPLTEHHFGEYVGYYLDDFRTDFFFQANVLGAMSSTRIASGMEMFPDVDEATKKKTVITRR